ncbi:MAG TPA: hypothetical protein VF161_05415 [Steroidobacteraceae bacterium]
MFTPLCLEDGRTRPCAWLQSGKFYAGWASEGACNCYTWPLWQSAYAASPQLLTRVLLRRHFADSA